MTNRTALQMKDLAFDSKRFVSIVTFLQNFKAACDVCKINEGAAKWLINHYLSGPGKSVIKALVASSTDTARVQEAYLTSCSAIINYLLKRYPTDDNITTADAAVQTFKQQGLTVTDYAQQLWTETLKSASVYIDKFPKSLPRGR